MMWFVHGNFTKENAIQIVEQARNLLNLQKVEKEQLSTVRCIQITGRHHRIDFDVEDEKNENSVLQSYFQFGIQGKDSHAKLLNEICL